MTNGWEFESEISRLRKNLIVETGQMCLLHNWLDGRRQLRQSGLIIGEAGTGKTLACRIYTHKHHPQQAASELPIMPVLYIHTPVDCDAKEMFRVILGSLNYQITRVTKETLTSLRECVLKVIKNCGVEMVIIDDAHYLKSKSFAEVKWICDQLKITIILVGTERLRSLVYRDEQLNNRFGIIYHCDNLSEEELKRTLTAWEQYVLKLPHLSNLTSDPMLRILRMAIQGSIRRLDFILRQAAIQSLQNGLMSIDVAILEEVVQQY